MKPDQRLILPAEAASHLGISISTLRRYEESGHLVPALRTKGGHRRYSVIQLVTFKNQSYSAAVK